MKSILLVEDDPNDVFLLQHAMKKAGMNHPVQVASDGQRAINYLKGAGEFADRKAFPMPGLILLDLKLPHVMGLDVLKWIRQQPDAGLIVVMLTSSREESDVTSAYRHGANGFLVKPSNSARREEMIKAVGDFWLTHNTLPGQSDLPEPLGVPRLPPVTMKSIPRANMTGNGKPNLDQAEP